MRLLSDGGGRRSRTPIRVFPRALVFGTRKRCRRFAPSDWSESRDSNPVRTVLQTVASTTSASPTWHTREELNLESQFWRLLPSPSGRVRGTPGRNRTCILRLVLSEPRLPIPPREQNWWAGGDSNSHARGASS